MDFDGETFKVSLLFVFQSVATSIAWSITPWGYYATWALEKEGIIISSVPYKRRNDDRCGLVVSFRLPSTNKLRLNWRNTKRRPKCTACIISIMQRRSAEEIFVTKKKKSFPAVGVKTCARVLGRVCMIFRPCPFGSDGGTHVTVRADLHRSLSWLGNDQVSAVSLEL